MTRFIKYILILIVLCFYVSISFAQPKSDKGNLSIAARGKAAGIAFFLLEDVNIRTGTLGVEFTYKNRHSLGVDVSYWKLWYQNDDPDPIPLYDEIEKRTFLYVDYKLHLFKIKDVHFYMNAYYKNGTYKMWYNRYYDNDSSGIDLSFTNSTTTGKFYEVGLGIGAKYYFNNSRVGIDFSVNAAARYGTNDKIIYDINLYEVQYNVKEQDYLPYLKLNLFYIIKKPSGFK